MLEAKANEEEPVPQVTATGNVYCKSCGAFVAFYYHGAIHTIKPGSGSIQGVGHFCSSDCKKKYTDAPSRIQKDKRNGTRSKTKRNK